LLTEAEQTLFARLSVFAGGCTFEAVEAVCRLDRALDVLEGLASLVDQSLLRQEGDIEPRFSMLETIREYAWDKLGERGEGDAPRRQHAEYFASMVMAAEPDIKGEREAAWFERFDRDRENIRAAIEWYRAHRPDAALLLGYVLHQYWIMRAELRERLRWIEDVYAHHDLLPPSQRAKVLDLAVSLADKVMHPRAEELFEQSIALREELGDITGKRDALERAAHRLLREGQSVEALRLFEESLQLQRDHGQTDSLRYEEDTLCGAILTAQIAGDYGRATAFAKEALGRARGRKNAHDIARWQTFRGWLAVLQGNHSQAEELLQQSLEVQRALADKNCMPTSLVNLAVLALEQRDPRKAEELVQEGLVYVRELQQTGRMAEHLVVLGRAAVMEGELVQGEKHFQDGLDLAERAADRRTRAEAVWGLAALATTQGHWERAMRLGGLASALQEGAGYRAAPIEQARYEQMLAAIRSHLDDEASVSAWEQGRGMCTEESLPDILLRT
jgi:tetratricopeptide (TPR) repeat protein